MKTLKPTQIRILVSLLLAYPLVALEVWNWCHWPAAIEWTIQEGRWVRLTDGSPWTDWVVAWMVQVLIIQLLVFHVWNLCNIIEPPNSERS